MTLFYKPEEQIQSGKRLYWFPCVIGENEMCSFLSPFKVFDNVASFDSSLFDLPSFFSVFFSVIIIFVGILFRFSFLAYDFKYKVDEKSFFKLAKNELTKNAEKQEISRENRNRDFTFSLILTFLYGTYLKEKSLHYIYIYIYRERERDDKQRFVIDVFLFSSSSSQAKCCTRGWRLCNNCRKTLTLLAVYMYFQPSAVIVKDFGRPSPCIELFYVINEYYWCGCSSPEVDVVYQIIHWSRKSSYNI